MFGYTQSGGKMVIVMKYFLLLSVGFSFVYGQTWESRGRVVDFADYYSELIQETIYEVERRGFCNLKLGDNTVAVNQQLYNWHVAGNLTYTNGFLVSIESIDVTDMAQFVSRRVVNNEQVPFAMVRGRLNLRNAKIGFDIIADLGNEGTHRFTGVFTHTLIQYQLDIMKDLLTKEQQAVSMLWSLSGGLTPIHYMPANRVSEVLSRTYVPSSNWNSFASWGSQVFSPIMVDIATNKLEFPRVCFSDC